MGHPAEVSQRGDGGIDAPIRTRTKSPLAAVAQGLAAGVIGTAVFTGYQALKARRSEAPAAEAAPPEDWSETPAPAQVGQRVAAGVFRRPVDLADAGLVKNVVHWVYGSSWGAVYALIQESVGQPVVSGVALTSVVMAADYTMLPAMKLYRPPWEYEGRTLATSRAILSTASRSRRRGVRCVLARRTSTSTPGACSISSVPPSMVISDGVNTARLGEARADVESGLGEQQPTIDNAGRIASGQAG